MSRLQVLMVDDEPSVRALVRVLLDSDDIEVLEAGNGGAALEKLEHDKVDAIVLDWMMPGVSGIEVLRRIRSHPTLSGLPIVMLTGISEDRLPEAVDAGADWIVTKPFVEEDLLEAIHSLFPSEPALAKGKHAAGPDTWIDLRS